MNKKGNILSMMPEELQGEMERLGAEKFRAMQIFEGLHSKLAESFGEIKGIPKTLSQKLEENLDIGGVIPMLISDSHDFDTKKFLYELPSGEKIETVLITENDRNTVCVSTQSGCNVGCEFCATGKMGFVKNLNAAEIVSQVYGVKRRTGAEITNIVYMGMGEPFLNYENMLRSLKILTYPKGLNLSSKRITVSTVGFKGRIKKFADDVAGDKNLSNVKLALSLHSTDNGVREGIIPTSKKNRLPEIYDELVYFYRTTGNKITYEYIYFEGLNDTEEDRKRLDKLSRMIPSNINIIPFHPIDFGLKKPLDILNGKTISKDKLADFITDLRSRGVTVNLRTSSGVDINAACGQLAIKNN